VIKIILLILQEAIVFVRLFVKHSKLISRLDDFAVFLIFIRWSIPDQI